MPGRMDNPTKHNQMIAIKLRLNEALDRKRMNLYQLTEAINSMPDSLGANYNTIKSAMNLSSDAIDLATAISICRCLHLDTAYIFSPPGTPNPHLPNEHSETGKFVVLNDPKYYGTFHGFMFSPNYKRTDLVNFDLDINNTLGDVRAVFTYHSHARTVNGETKEMDRVLYGTPVLDTVHSNIFIQLTNDLGDFYYLYYMRQTFRTQQLYFRRGIAITATSIQSHSPLAQNFVMFANPVPKDKLQYIPGFLAEVSPVFRVPTYKMNELREKNSLVETFYQSYKHILEHDSEEVYPISEVQILSSISPKMNEFDTIKALLLLKDVSTASKGVVYNELDSFSSFSKNYMQQP